MKYKIHYACICNTGKCRAVNQDNFVCLGFHLESENVGTPERIDGQTDICAPRLFGVFDGMGGEEHGEIAAFLASKKAASLNTFSDTPVDDLIRFCKDANEEICRYAAENQIPAMGTTAAILLFDRKRFYLCNIGDSKIIRYSEDALEQLSEDHLGPAFSGQKPPLSQNLGIPEDEFPIAPYTTSGFYHAGDKYLICSDGLTDMVSSETIRSVLQSSSPDVAASSLAEEALQNGGKDNITAIVIEILRSKTLWKKAFG